MKKLQWILSLAAVSSILGVPAVAQQKLPEEIRRGGKETLRAISPLKEIIQKSSAAFFDGYKPIVYGVIMSSEGHILTKTSEIEEAEELQIRIDRKLYKDFEILGADKEWDVSLVKVDGEGLPLIKLQEEEPVHGTIVVSNAATSSLRRRVQWGIISANSRELSAEERAGLGFSSVDSKRGIIVKKVPKKSKAYGLGIKSRDVILEFNGTSVSKKEELTEILKEYRPKEVVNLLIERQEKELTFKLPLEKHITRNDIMSGSISERRTKFPRILQHDSAMMARTMGGPLLNLEGECVGMNIAKANRSETFAIPAANLKQLYSALLKQGTGEGGGLLGKEEEPNEESEGDLP